ncbi:MAG: septum formation protein Maf [Hyphomicrobiales bacterium]|nr:MAG: septum formation protein Maf [Hyphomicrobiales bacterium]
MADPAARLVLASGSPFRRKMLQDAGLVFDVAVAKIDERALENALKARGQAVGASEIAVALAVAKAQAVSEQRPDALVIGCDQVLGFENELISKAEDVSAARAQLRLLRGKTHTLHSGIALVERGEVVWKHVEIARMSMRPFSDAFLEDYLRAMGERVCQTVGGYEIEGRGIQLFERIEGDHFTIIGLPLLALLGRLRDLGVVPA